MMAGLHETSSAGRIWFPGGPATLCMAGAGSSGVRSVSIGAARETVRPSPISRATVSTHSGVRYEDLRPYCEDMEGELPVAGDDWPWGDPHTYPQRPHPVGGNGEIFLRGAHALSGAAGRDTDCNR